MITYLSIALAFAISNVLVYFAPPLFKLKKPMLYKIIAASIWVVLLTVIFPLAVITFVADMNYRENVANAIKRKMA